MRILLLLLLSFSSLAQIQVVSGVASRGSESSGFDEDIQAFQERVEADGGTFVEACMPTKITQLGTFYSAASYLLIPGGYKDSKLYALVPGATGDLTFARSSAAFANTGTGITSVTSNDPRLEYCSYIIEPERTNLALRSQELDNATWVKTNSTISANATTAPDGTSTADKIVEATGTAAHGVRQNLTKAASSLQYVLQYYIKPAGRDWARITASDGGSNAIVAYYDVANGAKGSVEVLGSGFSIQDFNLESVGNGWYLCWVTFTTNTSTNLAVFCHPATGDLVQSFSGNTANGIYMWGAKLIQAGAPLSDSYVATTTASATRNADVISSLTSVSSLIGQTEGTLYVDLQTYHDGVAKSFSISDGTANNLVSISFSAGNLITATVTSGGVAQASIANTHFTSNTEYKIALTYQNNKAALFVNGVKIGEDLTVSVPACSQLDFALYGKINAIALSETALSDGDAQTLTDMPAVDAFTDFLSRIPPTRLSPNDPILVNDGTYENTCPAGIIVDPEDDTKLIFYRGEFFGSTTVGARISYFEFDPDTPYTLGTRQGIVLQGSESYDVNGTRFGFVFVNEGTVYYFYVGVDASYKWRICLATSTDGRTFTKQGVVLDYNDIDEKSVSDPYIVWDPTTERFWMMYTGWDGSVPPIANNNPGQSKVGIKLAWSTDLTSWTKTNTVLVPLGSNGTFDDNNVEGGQMLIVGSKVVILYNANNGTFWYIGIAYRDLADIDSQFYKRDVYFPPDTAEGTAVACPYIYSFPSGDIMYYQANDFEGGENLHIDIGAADLTIIP